MDLFKSKSRRWAVPAALSVALVTALVVSPAIGVPKFITGKKVNKTIAKKTQATELRVVNPKEAGNTFNLDATDSLITTMPLAQGNYLVSTTFTLVRDTGGLIVACELRVGGRKDDLDAFGGGSQLQDSGAMSVAAFVPQGGGSAQLRCGDGAPATVARLSNIEITALKLPRITLQSTP
jgi:hypothetical protein